MTNNRSAFVRPPRDPNRVAAALAKHSPEAASRYAAHQDERALVREETEAKPTAGTAGA